ncbi:MAG: RIO1 family regulatory kinase/ATPase [Zestosphaera sp.]
MRDVRSFAEHVLKSSSSSQQVVVLRELALIYRGLSPEDFRVLDVVNALAPRYEYVPLEELERLLRLPPSRIIKSLRSLIEVRALVKHHAMQGFRLTYLGLDLAALRKLSDSGVLGYLGTRVGVGKESEIYVAKTPAGRLVAVKFYKIGRVSFQRVKRVRPYAADESRWFVQSKTAAEREYKALKVLSPCTPYVPKVYGHVDHSVVMEYVQGVELYRYRAALSPETILHAIMSALRSAYLDVGLVHGDLSEYNVLVDVGGGEKPYIIDWPQYFLRGDPASEEVLRRDVSYIVKFFKRTYGLEVDVGRCLEFVKGLRDGL